MRDYEINDAQSRQAYGRMTRLVRLVKNWHMRKTLKQLRGYSDYQLRDIGLTRGDLDRLIGQPLDLDMCWQAERRALFKAKERSSHKTILALSVLGRAVYLEYPARNFGCVFGIV
jgi:uncharacterized protein YjiS (DUF1127 family)